MIFSPRNEKPKELNLKLGTQNILICTHTKFLGVWLDKNLDWNKHVDTLLIKLKQNIGLLRKSKNMLKKAALKSVYYAHFHSHLSYSISVWGSMLSAKQMQKL